MIFLCGLDDNVRNNNFKDMGFIHKEIHCREKTTKKATRNKLWNADGELALERKRYSFFHPSYHRKEREEYHMDAGIAIF